MHVWYGSGLATAYRDILDNIRLYIKVVIPRVKGKVGKIHFCFQPGETVIQNPLSNVGERHSRDTMYLSNLSGVILRTMNSRAPRLKWLQHFILKEYPIDREISTWTCMNLNLVHELVQVPVAMSLAIVYCYFWTVGLMHICCNKIFKIIKRLLRFARYYCSILARFTQCGTFIQSYSVTSI